MITHYSTYKRFSLFIIVVALLLVAGGCGGSSKSDSTSSQAISDQSAVTTHTGSLSKTHFIKRANAICAAAHERAAEEFSIYVNKNDIPESGPGMVAKATDVVATVFGPVYELQIEKISELGAPKGDEEEVEAILTAMQRGVEEAKRHPLQFIRHSTAFDNASKLAVAYGLSACGNGNV